MSDGPPTLYLTVGLPRSGKSTWAAAAARARGCPVVCPDQVRLAMHGQTFADRAEPFVWATVRVMVEALFGAGHREVILDATNTSRRRRDEFRDGPWRAVCVPIEADRLTCLARADQDGRYDLFGPINRMAEHFEGLGPDEEAADPDALLRAPAGPDVAAAMLPALPNDPDTLARLSEPTRRRAAPAPEPAPALVAAPDDPPDAAGVLERLRAEMERTPRNGPAPAAAPSLLDRIGRFVEMFDAGRREADAPAPPAPAPPGLLARHRCCPQCGQTAFEVDYQRFVPGRSPAPGPAAKAECLGCMWVGAFDELRPDPPPRAPAPAGAPDA